MSFFNLTLLGYEKPLQAAKVLKPEDKQKPTVSNLNYHNLRRKHVRGEQDSHFNLRQPVTEAQKIGASKSNEPWMKIQRHAHARSEMTKFVDDMTMTDPYFSLY